MKITRLICSAATALITAVGISSAASAMTIRHDVWGGYYQRRANFYPSVGRISINDSTVCSGTLIARRWVLTAAHCTDGFRFATFNVGRATYRVTNYYSYPRWRKSGGDLELGVDIALLRLNRPVRRVRPARLLPKRSRVLGRIGTYVGFGYTGTGVTGDIYQRTRVKRAIYNAIDAYGSRYYEQSLNRLLLSDFDNKSLLLSRLENPLGSTVPTLLEGSIALGDSGGGLFIRGRLTGVISFRANFDNTQNSDYGDIMGATRVSPFFRWLRATIRIANSKATSSLSLPTDSTTDRLKANSSIEATSLATNSKSIPEPSTVTGLLAIVFAAIFGRF